MSTEFKVGDTVCAYDLGRPYDAVVVNTMQEDGGDTQNMAFVHFRGWNRKYDSWYLCSDLAYKDDVEACMALHARLGDPTVSTKFTAKKSGGNENADATDEMDLEEEDGRPSSSSSRGTKKKRQRIEDQHMKEKLNELKRNRGVLAQSDLTDEGDEDRKLLSKLALPYAVKRHLVDEWSLITAEPKRLIALPRKYTVDRIFAEYMAFKAKKCNERELSDVKDVVDGLIVWFDRALPITLLYRQERPQYDHIVQEIEKNDLTPSKVYGGEHLARMFVRMASLMRGIYVKPEGADLFYGKIADFLKFFSKKDNVSKYFVLENYLEAEEALAMPLIGGSAEAPLAGEAESET
jgi:mortality factor 4-like protein 1